MITLLCQDCNIGISLPDDFLVPPVDAIRCIKTIEHNCIDDTKYPSRESPLVCSAGHILMEFGPAHHDGDKQQAALDWWAEHVRCTKE